MKDELRARFRAMRDAIPPAVRREASQKIGRLVSGLPEFGAAGTVLLYASFGSEVATDSLVEIAQDGGKRIVLPRMDGPVLTLHKLDPAQPLEPNRFGIPEPQSASESIQPGEVSLALVPGVAFDRRGARLGYGGGFYDRLLRGTPKAARIGLAFQAQVVATLPSTHLDVPMDVVVTENGIKRMPHRQH